MSPKNRIVVVFPGRFNPMHIGHLYVYDHLCEKFGKNNVWITTSNKQTASSPLSFKQKRFIATEFFGIPKSRIVECKVPYVPHELLDKLPYKDFSLILALGKKDKNRLAEGAYFGNLTENMDNLEKAQDKAYIYLTEMFANGRSATSIRKQFTSKLSEQKKKDLFIKLFGGYDKGIFHTLTNLS